MKTIITTFFLLLCALTYGQAPTISYTSPQTYAVGTAISDLTPTNTGGAVTTKTLVSTIATGALGSNVSGIAFSPDYSTIYVSLQVKYDIKKITLPSTVVDFAGTFGTFGFFDATGTAALFAATGSASIPSGIAVHPTTGEIYFADTNNHRIRKISTSGVVTTYAGTGTGTTVDGPIASATIKLPYDLAFDTDGSLYVSQGSYLRKISADGSTVSTICSSGAANSYGLAIDKTNRSIYISDKTGNKINKVNLLDATPAPVEFAGTGASFSAPRGLAVDAKGNVYVADYSNAVIKKITSEGIVTIIAGIVGTTGTANGVGTSAKFNGPSNLTFDGSGNLYVSESANQDIRKIEITNPFSISPALPAGLKFDVNTGKISGTPTASSASTNYTVTANNYTGSSTTNINITVNTTPDAPIITSITASGGQLSVAFTAGATGGSTITNYKYSTDNGSTFTSAGTMSSPITISGTTHSIQLKAVNIVGDGAAASSSSATDLIVLNGEFIIDQNTIANTATVYPGANLTLVNGKTLMVSTFTLQSGINGTATFKDNNATNGLTVTGTTTVQQYLGVARNWYISSPVSSAKAQTGYTFYYRDEANAVWSSPMTTGDGVNTGDLLNVGRGYIANLASGTATYTFTGALNSGTPSITVNRTLLQSNKPGFNLVGNPYPSYLNATTLVNSNANLEKTIWYRTQKKLSTTYCFDTYNTVGKQGTNNSNNVNFISGTVAPMQAFWVRVSAGQSSATINFSNTLRVQTSALNDTVSSLKLKSHMESSQSAIHLQISNGINSDETVLYSNPDASNGFDIYDSGKMSNNNTTIPELFTLAGIEQVAINGLKAFPYDTEIPLGFSTGTVGTYIIRASQLSNFDFGTQIFLKDYADLNNPVISDISDGSSYSFSSAATSNNTSRFTLIFRAPSFISGINQEINGNFWISSHAGRISVNGNFETNTRLDVFNALGQKICSKILIATEKQLNCDLPTGAYLISVSNAGKTITKKIIVN